MFKKIFLVVSLSLILTCDVFASADGLILYEKSRGLILHESDMHEQLPIASITKIMTAILTIESGDLDSEFVVSGEAVGIEGSSIGLRAGDVVTKEILIYGMMLESGNDAANAAAIAVSGSVSDFVALMNEKAQEIGMENTSFETPSGLDGEMHYSTAYDMALLCAYALDNELFSNVVSTKSYKAEFTTPQRTVTFYNSNRLLQSFEGTIGVKTGFTKKAGRTLVSAVVQDGITLICVTLNCGDDWDIHKSLYNKYFDTLSNVSFDTDGELSLPVISGDIKEVTLELAESLTAVMQNNSYEEIEIEYHLPRFLYAPIEKGENVGYANIIINGKIIDSVEIVSTVDILIDEDSENGTRKSDEDTKNSGGLWGWLTQILR